YLRLALGVLAGRRPRTTLFPYTPLFRSDLGVRGDRDVARTGPAGHPLKSGQAAAFASRRDTFMRCTLSPARWLQMKASRTSLSRSEEHTSELQSRENLVCRLLLEKRKHI